MIIRKDLGDDTPPVKNHCCEATRAEPSQAKITKAILSMSVSHNDADGGTGAQQAFDQLVAVVERLDQLLLTFASLLDRRTDRQNDRRTEGERSVKV